MATSGPAFPGALEVVRAARDRDASVVAFTDRPNDVLAAGAASIAVEAVPEWLSPFVTILSAQRLAVGLSLSRGIDVDRPFGLSKITRTT